MRKKIVINLIILVIVILSGIGVWAYKTGKLAGLADVAQEGSEVGVVISVKYEDNSPASFVMLESCFLEEGKDWVCQITVNTNAEGKTYFVTDCSRDPDNPICPGYRGPPQPNILYTKFRPVKDGYCSEPPFGMLRFSDQISKLNYLDFVLKLDGKCGGTISGKGSMSGFVYDADAEDNGQTRIAGALITLANDSTRFQENSNSDGTFSIRGIPAGEYGFTCSKNGYVTVTSDPNKISIKAGSDYPSAIGMHKAPPTKDKFKLVGKVVNRNNPNEYISGAKIKISWSKSEILYSKEGTTSERKNLGSFSDINLEIDDIPLVSDTQYNLYTLTVDHPEYELLSTDFTVDAGRLYYFWDLSSYVWRADLSLSPRPFFTIFGQVVEKKPRPNFPIGGIEISVGLYNGNDLLKNYQTTTDKYGKYSIDNIAYNNLEYRLIIKNACYKHITDKFNLATYPGDGRLEKNYQLIPYEVDCAVCNVCK